MENYEQKYKKALERARNMYEEAKKDGCPVDDFEIIFPELNESEDETMIKFIKKQLYDIKKTITDNYKLDAELTDAISWLEKQGEQKSTEWSEHQHKLLNYAISMTDDTEVKCFLESLRNTGSNTSADWSEEDSAMMNLLIEELNSIAKHNGCLKQYEPEINWLKSFKPNHWKPSEEQMEALEDAISCRTLSREQLETLYNDLIKKL